MPKCLKCKKEAKCSCKLGGGDGQFDRFILVCSCGHKEIIEKRIGRPDALFGSFSDEYPSCPFCGKIGREHVV